MDIIPIAELAGDVAFMRALRALKVSTDVGDKSLLWSPGDSQALLDLRDLSAGGSGSPLPAQSGYAGRILATDGANAYWYGAAEVDTWQARAVAAGGTFTARSVAYANYLMSALDRTTYKSKIKYLLPMLGGNLATARVPLIDQLNAGIASSTGFVDADFSESTGLQGDGTSKSLDSLVKPSQLGSGNNGGLGWWEGNFTGTGNSEPMGCYDNTGTVRFVLDLRAALRFFAWSNAGNRAGDVGAGANAHYYGNRSAATDRRFYANGILINTNTTNDAASGSGDHTIAICGGYDVSTSPPFSGVVPYPGRCKVAYMTDGTMTDAEAAAFHALLQTYLMTPFGR